MHYALLQRSLDQTISRADMEAASLAVKSVARADCARLQRELFGIVVDNLSREDALAFQAALRQRNFDTELVKTDELPRLPDAVRGFALRIEPDALVSVDMYQRERRFGWESFVFAAAGFLQRLRPRPHRNMEWVLEPRGKTMRKSLQMVTEQRLTPTPEFRLDCFFAVEPFRLQWVLSGESLLTVDNQRLSLRSRPQLRSLMARLRFLPAERLNLGIHKATGDEEFEYPSLRAFEEEIIWSFYRLTRQPP
jgi:hypothetical protein